MIATADRANAEANVQIVSDEEVDSSAEGLQFVHVSFRPQRTRGRARAAPVKATAKPQTKPGKAKKATAPAKKGAAKSKRKHSKSSDSQSESEDEEPSSDESYNPKTRFSSNKDAGSTGGVSFCSVCNRRFVVLVNTLKVDGRLVCGQCEKNPPKDVKVPTVRNARQIKRLRRDNTLKHDADWFDSDKLPSLQSICIQVLFVSSFLLSPLGRV